MLHDDRDRVCLVVNVSEKLLVRHLLHRALGHLLVISKGLDSVGMEISYNIFEHN